MLPRLVFSVPFALLALTPASSFAADDCPDGWFCEDSAAPQASPPLRGSNPPPRPGESSARPSRPGASGPEGPGAEPGYAAPNYPPPDYAPDYPPPPEPREPSDETIDLDVPDSPPPRVRRHRSFREWGFNLHLQAALLGNQPERASNAGMAGLGFGLRYRVLPPLAFEVGVDLLGGTDFQGYSRTERALLLNTIVFFNPHDVVQIYALGGFGFSGATVTIAPRSGETPFTHHDEHYNYFGAQLGLGAEIRVSRRIALAGDLVGFVRSRTDDLADTVPEFTHPDTHRATNSSGGGLLRAGISFYW